MTERCSNYDLVWRRPLQVGTETKNSPTESTQCSNPISCRPGSNVHIASGELYFRSTPRSAAGRTFGFPLAVLSTQTFHRTFSTVLVSVPV